LASLVTNAAARSAAVATSATLLPEMVRVVASLS
jgi:hypothetical protein